MEDESTRAFEDRLDPTVVSLILRGPTQQFDHDLRRLGLLLRRLVFVDSDVITRRHFVDPAAREQAGTRGLFWVRSA
jgi:hypothetical protein